MLLMSIGSMVTMFKYNTLSDIGCGMTTWKKY